MALAASATPAPARIQPSRSRPPRIPTWAGLSRSSAYPSPNPSAYTMGGRTTGTVGVVIALASIAGKAMMDSGAADRIVRAFLALLGVERGATALCATGYVLSIPVFFDTVFYLLVPLARSMYGRTNRNYLKYLLAIAAGAGATHTLVPPTPGPLAIAGTLGVDLGTMVLVGIVVALPAAGAGSLFAGWVDRRMPVVPQRPAALAVGASVVTAP